ncbi:hypothetical protein ACHAO7_012083 [Fusarium culmorum]
MGNLRRSVKRTKTGCLTCRERRKKCDEQKPICQNCLGNSRVCIYDPRQRGLGSQKHGNKAAIRPLRSKDPTYVPPGAYGMPQQSPHGNQLEQRETLPSCIDPNLPTDPPSEAHPLGTADDRPTASTLPSASSASPKNKCSASSYPPPSTSEAPVTAQLALSLLSSPQRSIQKEEMLLGRLFTPYDKELLMERDRCRTATSKFNNVHSAFIEGRRLFSKILEPTEPILISSTEASPITNVGCVGTEVIVEPPFHCDYGYNITIGNNVSIGRNCTIEDVREVKIGNNCVIKQNVMISTVEISDCPQERRGGQSLQLGKPVTIEEGCLISGGAIISPGVTIGKGSTVRTGSVVNANVPPFTVVGGNPAMVLYSIAS